MAYTAGMSKAWLIASNVERSVPHGGGVSGKRYCPCHPCRLKRNEYINDYKKKKRRLARQEAYVTKFEPNVRELAWAAGLFEGEGCASLHRGSGRTNRRYVALSLSSTDEDAVRRFHQAIGSLGNVHKGKNGTRTGKDIWHWRTARFEHSQAVIAMLWYGLGKRRRARCIEVLERCK